MSRNERPTSSFFIYSQIRVAIGSVWIFALTPIIFNTRDELVRVDLDKMVYAMAEDNYVHLHFRNGQNVLVGTTLQSLEKLILSVIVKDRKGVFTRIGRRYIVNNSYITQINILKQQLVLSDLDKLKPTVLSVSKEALKVLKQTMIEKTDK